MSHTVIRVTMPRFDCEKRPSSEGPTPDRLTGPALEPGNRPNPVSMHSPVGSTTSRPQALPQWSPIGVWPNPRSSVLPMMLQSGLAPVASIQRRERCSRRKLNNCRCVTPGSTVTYAELLVEVDDPVQSAEIEQHAVADRHAGPVSPVLAAC